MIFKKIVLMLSFSTALVLADTKLHFNIPLKEQIKEMNDDTDSFRKKFQYGIYFGNYLKAHPKKVKEFIDAFKYNPEKDILVIALKKAGISTDSIHYKNNYKIVDPMQFKKFYPNSVQVLLGEFRSDNNQTYFDKILDLNGSKHDLEGAKLEIEELARDYKFNLPVEKVISKDNNETNSSIELDEDF